MLRKNVKIELLKSVPLFSRCSKAELPELALIADEVVFEAGRELVREGDDGREFFILVKGTAEVRRKGRWRNALEEGDFFGEIALVDGGLRTATVTTTEPSRCLVLGPRQFQNVLHQDADIAHSVMKALTLRVREAGAAKAD